VCVEKDRGREREREIKTQKMWKFKQRRAPQFIFQYSANEHVRKCSIQIMEKDSLADREADVQITLTL
jgi:hypothetical protein